MMKAIQKGEIGIVMSIEDYIPFSRKPEDVAATVRLRDFYTGWLVQLFLICEINLYYYKII